jgi:hypothetical protein
MTGLGTLTELVAEIMGQRKTHPKKSEDWGTRKLFAHYVWSTRPSTQKKKIQKSKKSRSLTR